jgi:hypothetical protein
MSFFCPYCDTENSAGYAWQGILIRCPFCLREITLEYREGQGGSNSGYEISFKRFYQLFVNKDWNIRTRPLLERLLDCTVVAIDGRFVLKQKGGALIPYEVAHFTIQCDPAKQWELYQLYMRIRVGD